MCERARARPIRSRFKWTTSTFSCWRQAEPLDLQLQGSPRVLLAAGVEDVDAAYQTLSAKGVRFLRPPTDQPWGLRTAYFADPEGNLWEINQPVKAKSEG